MYERKLLEEIDKNILIEPAPFKNHWKASVLLNDKMFTYTTSTPYKSRANLILKIVSGIGTEKQEIILKKPVTEENNVSPTEIIPKVELEEIHPDTRKKIWFYRKRALGTIIFFTFIFKISIKILDVLFGERIQRKRMKGECISPKNILNDILGHLKLEIVSEVEHGVFDFRTTIQFCGILVEGKGYNAYVALQNACQLVFERVLKIDWEQASKGLTQSKSEDIA